MRSAITTIFVIVLSLVLISACGSGPANNAGTNANAGNKNSENKAPVQPEVKNNAPTLTPVFKAYCDAWVKNDEAALRKVYSSDTIKYFEDQMKQDKQKSLIKYLEDDKVSGTPCEVINEEINGDKAIGTIRSNVYTRGINIEFLKENGEWKMTNKSPGSVTQQPAANANASK